MSKFKVGDKIVIPPRKTGYTYNRKIRGTVIDVSQIFIAIKYSRYGKGLHSPDELVLEEVYNSPLYKLMREEDGT